LSAERCEDAQIRWTTLAMAAVATAALDQAVLEPGRSRAVALAATVGVRVIPAIVTAWYLGKRRSLPANWATIVALEMLFALPFASEGVALLVNGRCAMVEVTLMSALRNLGLGLAAMACRPVYARLSAVVSLFLVTVASAVGGEAGMAVVVPVGGFAVAGTLWLMLLYWKGLGLTTGVESVSRRLPFSGAAWLLGIVAMVVAVAALGPSRAAVALAGLVPTSGGTDWSDSEASSGVGDGDNEVSASEHPESVGFTESEVYLETDRPSLYDSFSETYGEPFKPKKMDQMIALGQQDVGEQKERPAENLQAGREFAAVRRKPEPRPRRPGERAARAMVYVKGQTPLHLPLTTYSHFDGTAWREEPCCNRHFPAELEPHSSWLRLPWSEAPFYAGVATHQVKIGTLESSSMPVPSHLTRFRVGSVNRLNFFGWAQFGIIRMTDRSVPAGTVIDSEARTVDPERLRSIVFPVRSADESDHQLSFLSDYTIDASVAALARGWVAGLPHDWSQVEAVIAGLRRGYAHDRSATAPAGCTDVVAEFLLRSGRGPDYLFASSSAVLLRSLGYPTRVVSGLYAAPGRYDPRTRHTPVTGEDVHFWAEVRLPNGLWIAVEPTPGYELLPPIRPWSERIAGALSATWSWARDHAVGLAIALAGLVVLCIRLRALVDRLATIAFGLVSGDDPRRCVMRAVKLIERRARWAGHPRPSGLTLARWYFPVAREVAGEPRADLERLVRLADWAVHDPDRSGLPASASERDIRQACRSAVRAWTLARFCDAIPSQLRKAATT
jgi:protein-glutamine gamma-glutamyltransferase